MHFYTCRLSHVCRLASVDIGRFLFDLLAKKTTILEGIRKSAMLQRNSHVTFRGRPSA